MLALHTEVAFGGTQFAPLRFANWSILAGPLKIPGTSVPGSAGLRVFPVPAFPYCMDSKNSMPLLSAVRVTTAFFQLAV